MLFAEFRDPFSGKLTVLLVPCRDLPKLSILIPISTSLSGPNCQLIANVQGCWSALSVPRGSMSKRARRANWASRSETPDSILPHNLLSFLCRQHHTVIHQMTALGCASRLTSSTYRVQTIPSLGFCGGVNSWPPYALQIPRMPQRRLMTDPRAVVGLHRFQRLFPVRRRRFLQTEQCLALASGISLINYTHFCSVAAAHV